MVADFAMGFNEVFTSSEAGSLHKECGLALAAGLFIDIPATPPIAAQAQWKTFRHQK